MEILSDLPLNIREAEVLRYLGYKTKVSQPPSNVKKLLEEAVKLGYELVKPRAVYTWARIEEMGEGTLVLEKGLKLSPGSSLKFWRGAEYLALALCTIGFELENRVSALFATGELPLALILDSVGSTAVDGVTDYVNYLISQKAKLLGARTGPRLSPGYGKWGLPDQRVLFALLPGESISVQLNEHCTMIPRKSVSFGAGMGKGIDIERQINPCRNCDMADCQYRVHALVPQAKGD